MKMESLSPLCTFKHDDGVLSDLIRCRGNLISDDSVKGKETLI